MPVIDAGVASPTANSYLLLSEAASYFSTRLPLAGWDNADDQNVLLIMATRVLDALLQPHVKFTPTETGGYYTTRRTWTGAPATTTQKLAWPRTGMYDANGNSIPSNVIPQALKEAVAELAGQLGTADRTLDNDISARGITSVRAGSVAVTFKETIESKVLPDAVWLLMPPSWFTEEITTYGRTAEFDVVSPGSSWP